MTLRPRRRARAEPRYAPRMSTDSLLTADYLVVGSGAMGMAFADVLVAESDATLAIVDRHHRPGGHWNDAYPFVRLHQPSAFYGVNSTPLGEGRIDERGWNAGLYELASGAEVCAYFEHVMERTLLPSGRVHYFPSCEYQGNGRFRSIPSGRSFRVEARKTVDATYMNVQVPSVRGPLYEVAPGVRCVPLNDLPREPRPEDGYLVVGAGKTGMDACLWLLANHVDPDAIRWIVPRDAWLLDRATIQPAALFGDLAAGFAAQMEAIAKAESVDDLFERVSACGQLLRLDPNVPPRMYRCATVTRAELEQLRRIRDVVRRGRVQRIEPERVVFEQGELTSEPGRLVVDCTADGLAKRPVAPVFDGETITLQSLRTCQQVFSAALIAHVELAREGDASKNELCQPVPHPNTDLDFLRTSLWNGRNQLRWAQDPELSAWLAGARLDVFSSFDPEAFAADPVMQATMQRFAENLMPAMANLERLLAGADVAGS